MSPGWRTHGVRDGRKKGMEEGIEDRSCRTVICQLSLTETPSLAEASQALQPPAPNDAGAPGHKAPAQGDKGFNSWTNTDDSFDKYRRGVVGGG